MKIPCLSAAFVLAALIASAQESKRDYSRAIKVYNLTDWESYSESWTQLDTNYFRSEESSLRIFHPTIAYQWQSKKGNYHELELISLNLSREKHMLETGSPATGTASLLETGVTTYRAALSVRYEYQVSLRPKDEKYWDFSIGLGVNPYLFYQLNHPQVSSIFPTSLLTFGTRVYGVPRFVWHVSPRIFLDVNVPVCLAEYRHQYHYDETPTIPIPERGRNNIEFSTLPALFSGRIGMGFKLY